MNEGLIGDKLLDVAILVLTVLLNVIGTLIVVQARQLVRSRDNHEKRISDLEKQYIEDYTEKRTLAIAEVDRRKELFRRIEALERKIG